MTTARTTGKVFISHSQQDNELARDLARRLERVGLKPMVLPDIPTGDWKKMLREQIRQADAMLILVTPAALDSDWVMAELGMAEGFERIILPVTAGLKRQDLPGPLRTYQVTPFDEVDKVIDALSEKLTAAATE
jgi:hypothetical protein